MRKNRIKDLRLQKGLSQSELAKKVGISNQVISFYENNKREPKIENWQKLADFFGVSVPYLQGFGLSKEEAINMCWEWVHKKRGYDNFQMDRILLNFFKSKFSEEERKTLFENKDIFSDFMNRRFKSVFNYNSLSKLKDQESLERKLTIALSPSTREGLQDGVLALIDDIDFKKDSNEKIQEIFTEIFENIFMYIDSKDDPDANSHLI